MIDIFFFHKFETTLLVFIYQLDNAVKTTEIYTHVLQQNLQSVVSPLDVL